MASKSVSPDLLAGCVHLSDLAPKLLAELAALGERLSVANGATVFADMDPADKLFLLVKGQVNICCEMGNGEMRIMDTVDEGELFAWSALVEPYRYTSTAIAATDCDVVAFDAKKLRALCQEDAALGYELLHKIMHLLTSRLESVRVQLAAS